MSHNNKKVINISAYEYIHVRDLNLSLVKVIEGPETYIVQENEEIVGKIPQTHVVIPPMNYIKVKNPVIMKEDGTPELENHGQPKLAHSEFEYRFSDKYKTPFFLYFGEEIVGPVTKLQFIRKNQAMKLCANRTFVDKDGTERTSGDCWLFEGPAFYYPRPEENQQEIVSAVIIKENQALRLRANQNFTDRNGVIRKAGEEYLVKTVGPYIIGVYETQLQLSQAEHITDKKALHLRATKGFKDCYGNDHKAGEEWILTDNTTTLHLMDIYEELVKTIDINILTKDQYAVILNPIGPNGKNQKGSKKLMKGEKSFFLQPGESLENGIQDIVILNENEAVLLQAKETFTDEQGSQRIAGDKWLIKGPSRFCPHIEIDVVDRRSRIPLDDKEGIYIRDTKTGNVRAHVGQSYLLESYEELWANELSEVEENILAKSQPGQGARDKTKLVTYKCPYNTVMQIFNFKTEKSRVVFGPELVMLDPDEKFRVMCLSGKTPKVPGVINTLCLSMGPTYTTDQIEVETSDHALLLIEVAYSWFFDVDKTNEEECNRIFNVRDCIGDMCSTLGSKVREAVAELTLNDFHKNSAKVIRKAVMGQTPEGKIAEKKLLKDNLLACSNVDIKNISTKNEETKAKLQLTVNLAIESTTKAQEEESNRAAEQRDQEAKSFLQRKIIEDNSKAIESKKILYEKKTISNLLEEQGGKEAEAKAKSSQKMIESESRIKIAQNNKDLQKLKNQFKNEIQGMEHQIHIDHEKSVNELQINKKVKITDIETAKFSKMINAIGQDTLTKIAQAGPESQLSLLKSLGLTGFVMTDGENPVNLFNFAQNLTNDN